MSAAELDLEQVAQRAVAAALDGGADAAEAWVERSWGVEVRVYEGGVESLAEAGSQGVGLRVLRGGRPGYAHGTEIGADGAGSLARAALAGAGTTDRDEHAGLPQRCGRAEVGGLLDPELDAWDSERKIALALAIEAAARSRPGVSQVEDTVYSDSSQTIALANSAGFSGSFEASAAWAYASAFAGEGAELMTGLGLGIGRGPAAIDPEAVGLEAAERALSLRGARKPASRRCPVVLDAFVAASFLGFIGAMLSADAVQRGRSLFAGREGEAVAAEGVGLRDDRTDPDGPASAPFDGEGVAARSTDLIEAGRLRTFLFDTRTARKAGRETTAGASRRSYRSPPEVGSSNLVVEPGDASLDELLERAGDGLYVTDVAGLHSGVNPVSGTFSVGASGRLISQGELAEPVREITVASDLVTMLKSVVGVGSQPRWVPFGGSVRAVPLLVAEMSVSGS